MDPTLFTQNELKMFRSQGCVRRINGRLTQAQRTMRPMHFQDLTIHFQFMHIGPGIYHSRWITGGIHQHPDLQFEYALSGLYRFKIGDQAFKLHEGQSLFIPPRTPHSWEIIEKGSMLGVLLAIDGANRKTFIDRMKRATENGKALLSSPKAAPLIRQIFLCLAHPRMELGGMDEIASLLDLFHIELLREQCALMQFRPIAIPNEANDAERPKQLAERAMKFLEINHVHSVQLRDVALHVGVSGRHINRVFTEHYSITINKTLLRIRLDHAFRLLSEHPDYSIKAIALDCGFSSAAYFTRCFGKAYGFSPLKAQGR